ncbi:hypothetical protein MC885_001289, partial [Smutsia gigantea]
MSEDPATPKDSSSLKSRPRSRSYSSTSIEEAMKKGEDPPTPPLWPQKTLSRASSSSDLNKVFQPSLPESSPTKKDIPYSQPPSKPIRRKFRLENQTAENQETSTTVGGPVSGATVKPHPTVQKQSSKQKKAIQTATSKNEEANAGLVRLNSELQQQLKEVHQEPVALENPVEQLRPVTVCGPQDP